MRISIFLLLVGVLQTYASTGYSQKARVSLNIRNAKVETVLDQIEENSEFYFLYNEKLVDVERKVDIVVNNERIENILKLVFNGTNVESQVIDRSIILSPGKMDISEPADQQKNVSGNITDEAGVTLPGVTVLLKGTTTGTVTDINGNYAISNLPENAILQFSFVGMKTQEVEVGGQTTINIVMRADAIGIEEVITIGYGTQKKVNLTGAVTNVKTENLETIPTSSITNTLAGRLSGVTISKPTAVPGASAKIQIRSSATWKGESTLFVIDGVVTTDQNLFDMLDPNEVEEISVLKDAASAAVYGVRGAGGVIVVKTKQGRKGKARIDYSSTFTVEQPTLIPEMYDNATELALIGNEALYNTLGPDKAYKQAGYWSKEELDWFVGENNGKPYYWLDEAYQNPTSQRHAVSVSGGTDNVRYYLGGSFFQQSGFLETLDYNKFNLRAKVDVDITKDLTVGMQLTRIDDSQDKYYGPTDNGDALHDTWSKLFYWDWAEPMYKTYEGQKVPVDIGWNPGNPVEMTRNGGYIRENDLITQAQLSATYKVPFVKGLSVGVRYNSNYFNQDNKTYANRYDMYKFKKDGKIYTDELVGIVKNKRPEYAYIEQLMSQRKEYQFNAQVDYLRKFNNHTIDATFVFEQYERNFHKMTGKREDFVLVETDQFWATSDELIRHSINGSESAESRLGYVGRVNYNYAEKYLLSVSARYDGNYKFAPGQRWGFFPSASVGWRISEESFFQDNVSFIDYMKLRGSLGVLGNDGNISPYMWSGEYSQTSGIYYFGEGSQTAFNQGINPPLTLPYHDATWEKSYSYNVGLDMAFLNNRLSFNGELWLRQTKDILENKNAEMPGTLGFNMPPQNCGEGEAKGLEIELGWKDQINKNLRYWVNGNFGIAVNKVIYKPYAVNGQRINDPNGRPFDYIAAVEYSDIIRSEDELQSILDENQARFGDENSPDYIPGYAGYSIFNKTPQIGMLNFKDVNGPNDDGKPDGKIDNWDKVVMSKYSTPPYTAGLGAGFQWKNIKVDALFQGAFGHKTLYNGGQWIRSNTRHQVFAMWKDHFVPEDLTLYDLNGEELGTIPANPDGKFPMVGMFNKDRQNIYKQMTSFWLYDASFVRLKNLMVSYTLPKNTLKKVGIQNVEIFVNGTNLYTWGYLAKNKLKDPEIGSPMHYPNMRTYSCGVKLSL